MTLKRQYLISIPVFLLLLWFFSQVSAIDPSSTDPTCFSDAGIAAVTSMGGGGGSLLVLSCPTGGSVYLDGFNAGTTPLQIQSIPNGTYNVQIKKTGYNNYQQSVTVSSDNPQIVKAVLIPKFNPWPTVTFPTFFPTYFPTYYPWPQNQIYISTTPPGASVFLDGTYMGVTPMTISQVNPGTHQIVMRYSGYNDYLYTITVSQVSVSSIIVQLTPLAPTVVPTIIPTVNPTPVTGSINVNSVPSGASVYLDNQYSGITPVTLSSVQPGNHNLELRLSGYNTWQTGISVSSQGSTTLTATLTPTGSTSGGKLSVSSVPSGAQVYIDSSYKGLTPVTITGISTGNHQVTLKLFGYTDWKTGISFTPTTDMSLSVTLTKGGSSKPNGYYSVHSNVNGAKVYFDDKLKGTIKNNGFSLKTTSAQYQSYGVEMNGYEPYYGDISDTPQNGGIVHLDAMLIKTNYYGRDIGWYVIRTNLNGAKVYFDGKYMGTTQNYGLVVQVYPATTQYSSYKVTYPGYKTVENLFTEAPDSFGTVDVDVTLAKN